MFSARPGHPVANVAVPDKPFRAAMPASLTVTKRRPACRNVVPAAARALAAAFFCLCLIISSATAQTLQPPTIAAVSVLDGPGADVDLAAALALEREGRFRPLPDGRYAAPGDKVFWLRLSLATPQGTQAGAYAVDLNWPFLRLFESYDTDGTPTFAAGQGEWNVYLAQPVPLPPGTAGETALYLRLAGYGGVNLNPSVVSLADVARLETLRPWVLGLFFGLVIAMLLYNLFLFLSLRDASYGYYVAGTTFLGLYYCCTTGLAPGWLDIRTAAQEMRFFLAFHLNAVLMFASMGLFTRSFLLTKKAAPGMDRMLLGQVAAAALLLPVVLVGGSTAAFAYAPMVGMATAATVTLAAAVRLAQGFRPAGVFLLGWGFYVACGFAHSMTWAGLVPATPLTLYAPMVGTAVEVFVMSLALAYRVKLLREQAASAEAQRRRLAEENARSESAREALARENALLSMILDDRRFGIGMMRGERFSFANRRLAQQLGREDLNGLTLAEVPQARPLLAGIAQAASDHEAEIEAVIENGGRSRTLRTVGRRLDPVRPERGTVFLVEDVSETKRLEQLKNDINQVMRHDLKSPLATVASALEALELAGPLNVRQRELTTMLERAVAAMTARINLSLHLYRLESGNMGLTPQPLPLAALLAEAREELAPYLTGGGELRIAYQAPAEAFVVLGERAMTTAMLVNLLKNALEAAGGAGPVFATVADPHRPRVVIDNPGETPPEIRARLFEKYATAGKARGTGLGAYSARLIARAFGGDVVADTSIPGRTVVTVTLRAPQDA